MLVDAEGNIASEIAVGAPGSSGWPEPTKRKLETVRLENDLVNPSADDLGCSRKVPGRVPEGVAQRSLVTCNMQIIRLGMHNSFLGSIMIGVGKATSSRGQSVRVAYFLGFLGDGRPGIAETGPLEHQ